MAGIPIADNFNIQMQKPLDGRIAYPTKATMKAQADSSLYNGCLAYCSEDDKYYKFLSSNTIDPDTGKWREFEAGGGGGSIPAGGTTGQALLKASNADEDVTWGNPVDANAFHTDETISDIVDDGSYFPYMYTAGQSFYKYRMSWGNVKSKLKTYFDQYYSGGGGGTSNYNDLTNKPQIASVTLSGNTELSTLGLTANVGTQLSGSSTKSYVTRGEKYDWNTGNTVYGTCSTLASTTAKSVTVSRGTFNFEAGARIAIKFSYSNTASAPTLTVNSTTKNIKYIDADGNVSTPLIWWNAGDVVEFTYDGTQWLMQPTMQMLFAGQGTKIPREQIYSTSEKVVGCWTDGRPVYQKTITSTLPTPTSDNVDATGTVSIGASIATLVSLNLMAKKSEGTTICVNETAILDGNGRCVRVYGFTNAGGSDANKVSIVNNKASWGGITCYITVQYTKTTDAANSFNYGDPNEYSTTEKIVGTWIDGKTLYQKTISCGALPNATIKTVSAGVTASKVKSIKGYSTNGSSVISLPFIVISDNSKSVGISIDSNGVNINTGTDRSGFTTTYVTIQYTK